jgi:glucose/arabinose dehydrogenase
VEQSGRIWIVEDGERLAEPFIDLSGIVSQDVLQRYSERGLLGLAFHPNYAENGEFFVNYTDRNGTTYLVRYTVSETDPNRADQDSARTLFQLEQPYPNHNGGHLEFGPDGYLYMSIGDGGAANDPLGAGQDLTNILGTIIRIDVDSDEGYVVPEDNPFVDREDAIPEIWSWGLRNVWRFSFDRATGDMYLADVGQNMWEEVNFQSADSSGGENYGWVAYEGSHPFASQSPPEDMIFPIAEYPHRNGDCSITGGYVYRGEAVEALEAVYIFGDYCSGRVWGTYLDEAGEWQTVELMDNNFQISSFGEDESGELYIVNYSGTVLRFDPAG